MMSPEYAAEDGPSGSISGEWKRGARYRATPRLYRHPVPDHTRTRNHNRIVSVPKLIGRGYLTGFDLRGNPLSHFLFFATI
jgi:hypothetical protein